MDDQPCWCLGCRHTALVHPAMVTLKPSHRPHIVDILLSAHNLRLTVTCVLYMAAVHAINAIPVIGLTKRQKGTDGMPDTSALLQHGMCGDSTASQSFAGDTFICYVTTDSLSSNKPHLKLCRVEHSSTKCLHSIQVIHITTHNFRRDSCCAVQPGPHMPHVRLYSSQHQFP